MFHVEHSTNEGKIKKRAVKPRARGLRVVRAEP